MIDIKHNTSYHAPRDAHDVSQHENIRLAARSFMEAIAEFAPESREQSLAFTKAEEALMWANAAIARNRDG